MQKSKWKKLTAVGDNMKKLIICLLAVSLMCLSSCSAIDEALEEANKLERSEESKAADDSMTILDYEIEATEYAVDKDEDGRDIIWVKYHFVNNDEDDISFYYGIKHGLYQNGVKLEQSYKYTPVNQDVFIKSGASVDVEIVYNLIDTTTDVEIVFELGDAIVNFGEGADKKLTQYIKISEYFEESK